jgi:hypothetical protein
MRNFSDVMENEEAATKDRKDQKEAGRRQSIRASGVATAKLAGIKAKRRQSRKD